MQSTEKRSSSGKFIVILILGLAILAAAMAALRQQRDNPSTTQARIIDQKTVAAEFSAGAASPITEGMRATVSIGDGEKYTGRVIEKEKNGATFQVSIRVENLKGGIAAGAPCEVTVDTTIPADLLK